MRFTRCIRNAADAPWSMSIPVNEVDDDRPPVHKKATVLCRKRPRDSAFRPRRSAAGATR